LKKRNQMFELKYRPNHVGFMCIKLIVDIKPGHNGNIAI